MKFRLTLALLLPALTGQAQTTLTNDHSNLTVEAGATLFVAGTVQNSPGSSGAMCATAHPSAYMPGSNILA